MTNPVFIFQLINAIGVRSEAILATVDELKSALRQIYDEHSLTRIHVLVIACLTDDVSVIDHRGVSQMPIVTAYRFCNPVNPEVSVGAKS